MFIYRRLKKRTVEDMDGLKYNFARCSSARDMKGRIKDE